MSERDGKRRNIYVYHPKDRSKPTCLIHGPIHSSDECKVLGDFGSRYDKNIHTKDCGHNLAHRKKFNRQEEKNAIVNHEVY